MADCGLLTLASCLPGAFFDYLTGLVNAPIQPLLSLVQGLISTSVDLSPFIDLWAIIIYVLSIFYAILIIYSGFQFIVSGYDAAKRENAKEWFKNIVIMIVLVQASYFIYQLFLQIASSLTSSTLTLMANGFFTPVINNVSNALMELVFFIVYIIVLLFTSLILIIRYCLVAIGLVLFPLAIFFYFIPALKSYGVFLLNILGIATFVTFIDAVMLVGFSRLENIGLFANVQILVVIAAFALIDLMMLFLMFFSIIKGAVSIGTKITGFMGKFA